MPIYPRRYAPAISAINVNGGMHRFNASATRTDVKLKLFNDCTLYITSQDQLC